jgi:hypothetical protein
MCFGGGGSQPQATVTTPAVPVDQISAGHPTITVQQNPSQAPDPASTRTTTPNTQSTGATGLNTLGM